MNERFKLLAQEAGMYVDLNGNPWPKWMSAEECEVAYKKFAELIVKEGYQVVTSIPTISTSLAGRNMLNHFGVE